MKNKQIMVLPPTGTAGSNSGDFLAEQQFRLKVNVENGILNEHFYLNEKINNSSRKE